MSDEVFGPDDWRQLTNAPLPALPVLTVQCSAIKGDGEQCKQLVATGSLFCRFHGGNTISAQDQTRRRLDLVRSELFDKLVVAAGEAVDVYIGIMRNGKKDADRLKAADRVLELLGVSDQVVQVNVKHTVETSDIERELAGLLQGLTQDKLNEVIDTTAVETDIHS